MLPQDKTLGRVLADRRAAFADLARVHKARLLSAARRLCRGDEDRAQDLVQDALIRAYEAYLGGKFREGLNAHAWFLSYPDEFLRSGTSPTARAVWRLRQPCAPRAPSCALWYRWKPAWRVCPRNAGRIWKPPGRRRTEGRDAVRAPSARSCRASRPFPAAHALVGLRKEERSGRSGS